MKYRLSRDNQHITTVHDEQTARRKAIEFDIEDPADICIQDDDGNTKGYIILVHRRDSNGVETWV